MGVGARAEQISVDLAGWSLEPLTAELPQGCTALLGANGAGKSTLIRSMLGIQRGSKGYFEIEGLRSNVRGDRRAFRGAIGYSPQKADYPRFVTARDALTFAADLKGVPRARRRAAVGRAARTVNLEARLSVPAAKLSGGEQRRLSLAQATIHRPRLVLLDEPTAGLDPVQRLEFREWLRRHCETGSALVSTHLIEDVAPIAQHVIVLRDGKCSYSGPARDQDMLFALLQQDSE